MKSFLLSLVVLGLTSTGYALTNPNFDTNGAGWATYAPSSSITFSGGQAHLNKVPADGIAIWRMNLPSQPRRTGRCL
jgi:hypothetical protein